MTDASSAGPFRLQRVFAIAFAAFRARWAPMLATAFLLSYLPAAAQGGFTPHYKAETETVEILHPPPRPPDASPRVASTAQAETHAGHLGPWEMFVDAGSLVTWWPLRFACGIALGGALASLTMSSVLHDRAPWRRAVRETAVNLLPLLMISVVRGIATVVGGILIVPGVIALAAWSVARPAQIAERTGVIGSLRRSAALTRGHRWVIVGMIGVWVAAFVALETVTSLIPALLGFGGLARFDQPIVGALGNLVYDVFIAALYLELRRAKDGVALGEIDQVFA